VEEIPSETGQNQLLTPTTSPSDGRVTLVTQTRVATEGHSAYAEWQGRVAEFLAAAPGFISQEVIPPSPPVQVDWVVIQKFQTQEDARAWLQSEDRRRLLGEVKTHFIGNDDIHLLTENEAQRQKTAVSVVISCRVEPGNEKAFLEWQRRISAAEAKYHGFLGHKVEPPVLGVHEDWVTILTFDSEKNLNAWLESPQRAKLLSEGHEFNTNLRLRTAIYGFDFWFRGERGNRQSQVPVFKSNLLVLLVLYPIVFLWGYFISAPFLDSKGVPFWLSLFVGNLFSTQLLGWLAVPVVFRLFGWWLDPKPALWRQVVGYGLLLTLYAISMAGYAWLLSRAG
jgi:uncharacterized protein